ncbi:MAG: ISNCY family transposase [Gemmataceae bacterium]
MSIGATDRIEMSQRERDVLTVMRAVLRGDRTQAEAAELLGLSARQVRRIQRRLEAGGDGAVGHGLRGRPSNRKADGEVRRRAVPAYRARYPDFGPTLAAEKLAEEGLHVGRETLRRWLIDAGLWSRQGRREEHRSRRPRRAPFGELVQMDASIHDWLEGRGEEVVLISMIDDATGVILARFFRAGTVLTHMELLGLWLPKHGRPVALYTDRHSTFEPQDKGRASPGGVTQFGRALQELGVELIRARGPQAKGRVERSFGTAQDRRVKELRLAGARTAEQATEVLARVLPAHNRRFAKEAKDATDADRPLGPGHDLGAILSVQATRAASNDYVARLDGRLYQLLPPALPGLRGGKVVLERRIDGSPRVRFGGRYRKYEAVGAAGPGGGGALPPDPRVTASAADAREGPAPGEGGRAGVQPAGGRSGCTPAEPYPPDGGAGDSARPKGRPAQNHPWRRPFKPQKCQRPDTGHF